MKLKRNLQFREDHWRVGFVLELRFGSTFCFSYPFALFPVLFDQHFQSQNFFSLLFDFSFFFFFSSAYFSFFDTPPPSLNRKKPPRRWCWPSPHPRCRHWPACCIWWRKQFTRTSDKTDSVYSKESSHPLFIKTATVIRYRYSESLMTESLASPHDNLKLLISTSQTLLISQIRTRHTYILRVFNLTREEIRGMIAPYIRDSDYYVC